MDRQKPLFTVAILTWNRKADVIRAIESVYRQTYSPIEIVVVDSASTDGTYETIATQFPSVKLFRLHKNLGCPEGRNVAFANTNGSFVYFLDDDGWLDENALERCAEVFEQDESVAVVVSRIISPGEVPAPPNDQVKHSAVTFLGGASAIRSSAISKCGLYPSNFFRQAEESDLALRLIDKGFRIVWNERSLMYHEPSPTNRNQKLFWYFGCRNELMTVVRLYPWYAVPIGLSQKAAVWLMHGIRNHALLHILLAFGSFLIRVPECIRDRQPISSATLRAVMVRKVESKVNLSG